jgi:hypothetical protein
MLHQQPQLSLLEEPKAIDTTVALLMLAFRAEWDGLGDSDLFTVSLMY